MLRGAFLRSVLTLAGGATLAMAIPLLFSPLLTRLYSPNEFALLTLFVSWLSNLAVAAGGRYELAVVLPAEDRDATHLLALAMIVCTALSVAALLPALAAREAIATWLGAAELAPWLLFLPVSLWCAGAAQIWVNRNNRLRRYDANAQGRVAQALTLTAVQIAGGFAGFGVAALIIGQTAGQAAALLGEWRRDMNERFACFSGVSVEGLKRLAWQYREFPAVNTPHAFAVALQDSFLLWLIAHFAGTAVVGYYGLVLRVLKLPAAIVGQAVSQVIYRDLAEAHTRGRPLRPVLCKTLKLLAALAVLPFGLLAARGEWLFSLVFGSAWGEAGRLAAILAPSFFLSFACAPAFMVPMVLKRQRTSFALALGWLSANLAAFAAVIVMTRDTVWAFATMSVVMSLYLASYTIWVLRLCRREDRRCRGAVPC
ncbi:O-antigen translocase [Paludibacterium paludis]|uniref:O-antigen translocase n=2 Tax=Paludibacterium paludis TaxID=1225769 RepID=A0A918UA05_9NEIS|nr:O-antigen translocase [Paludibacterium paludis]